MAFKHLSSEEGHYIEIEVKNGTSQNKIAEKLGRSQSSLSRELGRKQGSVVTGTSRLIVRLNSVIRKNARR